MIFAYTKDIGKIFTFPTFLTFSCLTLYISYRIIMVWFIYSRTRFLAVPKLRTCFCFVPTTAYNLFFQQSSDIFLYVTTSKWTSVDVEFIANKQQFRKFQLIEYVVLHKNKIARVYSIFNVRRINIKNIVRAKTF